MQTLESSLRSFLDKFPNNAKCWSKATDEISDMYYWMTCHYNEYHEERPSLRLKAVGRDNCHTPAEWNTKYKTAILSAFKKFEDKHKQEFAERFSNWLK